QLCAVVLAHDGRAFGNRLPLVATRTSLSHPGFYKFKKDGEYHSFSPAVVHALQKAANGGDYAAYRAYSDLVHTRPPTELRDLLEFVPRASVPLNSVEHATDRVRPCCRAA